MKRTRVDKFHHSLCIQCKSLTFMYAHAEADSAYAMNANLPMEMLASSLFLRRNEGTRIIAERYNLA